MKETEEVVCDRTKVEVISPTNFLRRSLKSNCVILEN